MMAIATRQQESAFAWGLFDDLHDAPTNIIPALCFSDDYSQVAGLAVQCHKSSNEKGPALQSLGIKSRVLRVTSLAINPTRAAEKRAVFALQSQHPTCWAVGSARLETITEECSYSVTPGLSTWARDLQNIPL
ncbi:hypothetical protein [Delftia deserti]|uniref:Uncharacterized protein n=1 Tax=Delftia deserti TaxID=1651218 RepID=A0ABW5ETM3_9BURK